MKTSVEMVREMGTMGNLSVIQRTSDGMFDAGILLEGWNSIKGNTRRRIDRFLGTAKTKEFINEIKAQEPLGKNAQSENEPVIVQKGRMTQSGRTSDKVWMHPFLFIDFAMYINPTFKYKVIQFVHDNLIAFRHDAGDKYKELSSVGINNVKGYQFVETARGINKVVFGKHESGLRQTATEEQLKTLNEVEGNLTNAIEMGYITDMKGVRKFLKKQPQILSTK